MPTLLIVIIGLMSYMHAPAPAKVVAVICLVWVLALKTRAAIIDRQATQ